MGALNSPRALEWFEFGRTEWLRAAGMPYSELERQGLFLPAVEANCRYLKRVRFDDPIELVTRLTQVGRASIRFDYLARLPEAGSDNRVLVGWTTHAFVDANGNVIRPPAEVVQRLRTMISVAEAEPGAPRG